MKEPRGIRTYVLAVLCLASVFAAQARATEYTWAIKINDKLCGYSDASVSMAGENGREYRLIEQTMVFSAVVLGLNVDRRVAVTYHVDPGTGQYDYYTRHVTGDEIDLRSEVVVEGDTAVFNPLLSSETQQVTLPPGVVLADSVFGAWLTRDFAGDDAASRDYLVLDPDNLDTPVQTITCTRAGTDVIKAAGATYDVVIIDTLNKVTGAKSRQWLSTADGLVVKVILPNGTEVSLADPAVRERIERVDVDSLILSKAQTDITDVSSISFMKVSASMEPVGAWLDAEDLNVPGQRFAGEVHENRIEGVFEIEHPRYDGAGAPPYPPDFTTDESLASFLKPGQLIQSDDAVLVEKARAIAEGSADSWEAAVRLSAWVADNIGYEIPGGVFSRKVYDMRVGECGGHSVLLAAFCRAVGIPARCVWGCMYTPMAGGSFGQHAWTEVYMGQAGWIPVDSTAHETDYVDSGHIRLGTFGSARGSSVTAISLGAKEMEVLDYRLTGGDAEASASAAGKYAAYVGGYEVPGFDEPFRVLVKDGGLAIDIPGQMVIPMKDPDENGDWVCALSSAIYCSFVQDDSGVTGMTFHEIVRLRRKSDPEQIPDDVPGDLRPYLGGYYLAQANTEYQLTWDDGELGLYNPGPGKTAHLEPTGVEGHWTIEAGRKAISFIHDDAGGVISMSIDVGSDFPRVE